MNKMKFFVATLSLVTFSVACSSQPKVAAQQKPAPVAAGKSFSQFKELTMVNVVTVTRYPASEDGLKDISKKEDPVVVTSQVFKSPGEKIKHSMLLFTVKGHPEIAGQIMGNSGGSPISTKFTQIVGRIQAEGVTPKAAGIISKAQVRFNELVNVSAEQRADAIKTVLYETRDQLIAAY